jgi:hypothetical protein
MKHLRKLLEGVKLLISKRMDIPVRTGTNIGSYEENVIGVSEEFSEFDSQAIAAVQTADDNLVEARKKLKEKTTELNMSLRNEQGQNLEGELGSVDAEHVPKIERIKRKIVNLKDDLQEMKKHLPAVLPGKTTLKSVIGLIIAEAVVMAIIIFNETSINKIVFDLMDVTPSKAELYAYGMSVALAGYMWVAGYFMKIGFFNEGRQWRGFGVAGVTMVIPIFVLVWYLVQQRNALLVYNNPDMDIVNTPVLFFTLSCLYYLLGALPPILFADSTPFWEKKKIKNMTDQYRSKQKELEDTEDDLANMESKHGSAAAALKNQFSVGKNGVLLSKELKELSEEVSITLPGTVRELEIVLDQVKDEANEIKDFTTKCTREYVQALTAKYDENLPATDIDKFVEIKTKSSIKRFLNTVAMLAGVIFVMSSCNHNNTAIPATKHEIITILDKTESVDYSGKLNLDSYLQTMKVDPKGSSNESKTTGRGSCIFTVINDVDINNEHTATLEYDRDLNTGTVITQKIRNFITDLSSAIDEIGDPTEGEESSRIFGPIVRGVERFSDDSDKRHLVIFSDLLENRPGEFSFYQHMKVLGTNRDTIVRNSLEELYSEVLPDMSGIDVTLVYDQKNGHANPDHANKASRFYKRWFEENGAQVTVAANY